MKRVAVIIPCFNESGNIEKVIESIRLLPQNSTYELHPIPVNDCSTDNTLDCIKQLNVEFLNLPINLGIGGTVQAGFKYAFQEGFDIALQLDGDGQHPPSEIHKIVEPLINENIDIVIGSRFLDKEGFQSSIMRRFGIKYFYWLNKGLTGLKVLDSTSGFRAFNRKAIMLAQKHYPDDYPEPEAVVLFHLQGLRFKEVPVVMKARDFGESSIQSFKSIYYMLKVTLAILSTFIKLKFKL